VTLVIGSLKFQVLDCGSLQNKIYSTLKAQIKKIKKKHYDAMKGLYLFE
jgi:CCR4-NOT transcriptional regulation complex NOT5 subunit